MEHLKTISSKILENISWCLICSSAHTKFNLSTGKLNDTGNNDNDRNRLTTATAKIFQYLHIPKDHLKNITKTKFILSFCPSCVVLIEEIIELQKKIEIAELQIQWKVETLGKITIESPDQPAFTGNNKRSQKEVFEVLKTFKAHVTRNFQQGLIQNPSVKLDKNLSKNSLVCSQKQKTKSRPKPKSIKQKIGNNESNNYIYTDRSSYSKIFESEIKTETDENNIVVEEEEDIICEGEQYDSNDDLFEVVTVPVNCPKRKETNNRKQFEAFKNNKGYDSADCASENEEPNYNLKFQVSNIPTKDTANEEITIEKETFLKDTQNSENFDDLRENFATEMEKPNTEVSSNQTQKFQPPIPATESISIENTELEISSRLRPRQSVRLNECDDIPNRRFNIFEDELLDESSNSIDSDKELYISGTDSDTDSSSRSSQSRKKQKFHKSVKLADSQYSVGQTKISILSSKDADELKKELEGLIEGKHYMKCTKCEYIAKNNSISNDPNDASKLRIRIATHYSIHHNPVKRECKSKTIDGKDCYKCTKCNFSVVFLKSGSSKTFYPSIYLRILSLHYMEFHDALEAHRNQYNLKSLTEGLDYFRCAVGNCSFLSFIIRERSEKQNLQNATEARLKIIEHYRTSPSHFKTKERKNTLSEIKNMFADETGNTQFYKCTKCDFKSNFQKTHQDFRKIAQKALIFHFLLEHAFPWEIFPGLYKYGCYQVKCQDGNILKCPYSNCFYFVQIPNKSEGKSHDECELAAYQSFSDKHSSKHNYNSMGFNGDYLQKTKTNRHSIKPISKPRKNTPQSEPRVLPEGLTEGKDYIKCPKCEFFTLSTDSKANNVNNVRVFLRKRIASHYALNHSQVKETDLFKTSDGEDCYKCTKCDFQVVKKWSKQKRSKHYYYVLCLHYVDIHDGLTSKETTPNPDKLKGLIERKDYYKCPDSDCKFYVIIEKNRDQSRKIVSNSSNKIARRRVIAHFNLNHNPELKAILSKSAVLDESDGTVCFQCFKCEYKSVVEPTKKGRSAAQERMKEHFTKTHLQPWKNFPGLYPPHKITEEKCGDDEVLKCSHPGCHFVAKINYVDGESREKSRIKAHHAIYSHYKWHDSRITPYHYKGYGNTLPLYKGNQKFVFSLKASEDVRKTSVSALAELEKVSANLSHNSQTVQKVVVTAQHDVQSVGNLINSSLEVNKTCKVIESGATDAPSNTIGTVETDLSIRRSKRTLARKRKRYDSDDFVACNDEDDVQASIRNQEESENQGAVAPKRNKREMNGSKKMSQQFSSDKPCESPEYPNEDHYRCWKCDFFVKVQYDYKKQVGHQSNCRHRAKHRLAIHFNATHNSKELASHDPDKLLEAVEGKDCFRCPRCDYYEEIKFNPKKHADKIQGRKNARVNLGRHFFFIHCLPERPDIPIVEEINVE